MADTHTVIAPLASVLPCYSAVQRASQHILHSLARGAAPALKEAGSQAAAPTRPGGCSRRMAGTPCAASSASNAAIAAAAPPSAESAAGAAGWSGPDGVPPILTLATASAGASIMPPPPPPPSFAIVGDAVRDGPKEGFCSPPAPAPGEHGKAGARGDDGWLPSVLPPAARGDPTCGPPLRWVIRAGSRTRSAPVPGE